MQIDKAIEQLRELRRTYSKILYLSLSEDIEDEYEYEDLIRLIGHLQTSYDHLLASKARDNDIYCVIAKHLPAALILAGEIGTDVRPIYSIMSLLTNNKIQPCSSCKSEENSV